MIYKGYSIVAFDFGWMISKDDFFLFDFRSIDGGKIMGEKHAMNDAKKNIDRMLLIR